jgi:hypothetical protein
MHTTLDYALAGTVVILEVWALSIAFRRWKRTKVILRFGGPLIELFLLITAANIFIALLLYPDKSIALQAIPTACFTIALFALFFAAGYLMSRMNGLAPFPALRSLSGAAKTAPRRHAVFHWKAALIIAASIDLYSILILFAFHPKAIGQPARILPEILLSPHATNFQFLLFLTGAAFYEEILFRLFVQNLFERLLRKFSLRVPIAIAATSAFWAMGHYGMLVPHGVKELQIFGVGLVLGYASRRYGLEVCIVAHLALNLFAFVIRGLS